MQKCKTCGKQVKYIATTKNTSVICDTDEMVFYTITGRKVEGYKIHKCDGVYQNERKSDLDNK